MVHLFDASSSDESSSNIWSDGASTNSDPVINPNVPKVVLVTGGAGFIGSHTCGLLLDRGDKVVVIDEVNDYYDVRIKRSNIEILKQKSNDMLPFEDVEESEDESSKYKPIFRNSRFAFYEGDICDAGLIDHIFKVHRPSHVCHLAARAGVRPSIDSPLLYVQSNIVGTVTLLEAAASNGVVNFVYASSSSVYGGSMKEKFSEEDRVEAPVSQYAATKKSCELFAATYHSLYGLNCTGLRFFTVYGERGRPDMAPFKFINRVLKGETIDQYGDGSSERDYTHVEDICNGVLLALDKILGNEVINLGRGSPITLNHFIQTIEKLCGKKAKINRLPMQPGDVMRTSCDTSKAYKLLGYEAKISVEDGLRRTIDWFKQWDSLNKTSTL